MAKDSTTIHLSPRELELLASAISQCAKTEIAIDYQKFADVVGYKNSNSAKAGWHAIKKKLETMVAVSGAKDEGDDDAANYADETTAEPKGNAKANKSVKRKAPIKSEVDGDEDATEAPKSPVKKARKAATKIAETDGEAPKSPVKKTRKAPAKKKAASDEDGEQDAGTVDSKEVKKATAKKGRSAKAKKGKGAATDDEGAEEE